MGYVSKFFRMIGDGLYEMGRGMSSISIFPPQIRYQKRDLYDPKSLKRDMEAMVSDWKKVGQDWEKVGQDFTNVDLSEVVRKIEQEKTK